MSMQTMEGGAPTLENRLSKAALTLAPGIKTRDVGTCEACGGGTSSGMNPYCAMCAFGVLAEAVPTLAALQRENEALREALEEIALIHKSHAPTLGAMCNVACEMGQIALRALSSPSPATEEAR